MKPFYYVMTDVNDSFMARVPPDNFDTKFSNTAIHIIHTFIEE